MTFSAVPYAQGLYDPANEHDACGVAFVVDARGRRSHAIVEAGLTALRNLEHRGAAGSEVNSGDGAGILVQVPHEFLRAVTDFPLPEPTASGEPTYAVGNAFLPADTSQRVRAIEVIERIISEEGVKLVGWRDLPTDAQGADLGPAARSVQPHFAQLFISGGSGLALERLAFVVRRRVERETRERGVEVYFSSLSARTVVYKGMLTTNQLPAFFPDLSDPRLTSAIALVHSRFSTNTFPSWPLAHPYRYKAHNGEINTLNGNRNWMRAREALLESDLIPGDLRRLFPICTPAASDSASFDEVLELLHLGGRPLAHAVLMMIPEAWENNSAMDQERRAFYEFHASVMEPWDGPACIAFTDGTQIGAVLDRNGLRPARWWRTSGDIVVFASEAGVLDFDPATIVAKGRLQPGRMFLVDTAAGRIVDDEEIKSELAAEHPYSDWLHAGLMRLSELPGREHVTYGHGCEYMTGGRVAVLGPTGRNFAAGMSGGIAHVLNLDRSLVNTEMVDIEPLSVEDAVELRSIVERHYAETGSVVAGAILADWPRHSVAFSTIMPREYRRVLQASRLAELAGRDVDEAIMEAARG